MDTLQPFGFDSLSGELAQELYDPANRLVSDSQLANRREEFVGFVLNLYGVESPASTDLLPALACDAVESGIEEDELIERAKVVNAAQLVVPSIRNLLERTGRQAADILGNLDIETVPQEKRALVACDAIAQAAYEGKTRKTGERYYEHPRRAAAMVLQTFSQLEAEGYKIEPEFKDTVICGAFLHDATEETVRSCKYYDPDRPKGYTPLLIREIFRQTGNPHGQIIANSLRLMTHYAKQPWAPDYRTYVTLGSSDFIFNLIKSSDMKDNLLHPKPITPDADVERKSAEKRALYTELIGTLAINTPRRTDNTFNKIWARRYFTTLGNITADDVPPMLQTLDEYIYGNKAAVKQEQIAELAV